MTSYNTEQDYLRDQIRSNNLAIKFLQEKIKLIQYEFTFDYLGTERKIEKALLDGINALKADSKEKRSQIKELDTEGSKD